MTAALTPAVTIWKKLTAAVFWILALPLAFLGHQLHYFTPRKRPAARHARPRAADEDAQTVAWFRRLHEQPARVMASPLAMIRTVVLGNMLRDIASTRPQQHGQQAKVGPPPSMPVPPPPPPPVRADRGCRAELCKYWPGDGCMRGVMPCDDDGDVPPWAEGVPAADVDMYLAEHAAQHTAGVPWDQYLAEQYPPRFDRVYPVLAGEIAPVPWVGPFVDGQDLGLGYQPGDVHLTAPMGCVPEPDLEPLPPGRACPDVDQPTAILRAYTRDPFDTDEPPCFCPMESPDPITTPEFCPAHGDPDKPAPEPPTEAGCPAHGDGDPEPYETDDEFIASVAPFLPPEATAVPGDPGHDRVFWGGHYGQPGEPGDPEDVPGPAESASPPPVAGAEAASPPAAPAGPGTPAHDGGPGSSAEQSARTAGSREGVRREAAGSNPAPAAIVTDDTVTDLPVIADRTFVNDVAARPLDHEAWLDLCLHGDMDTIREVTR